MANRSSSSAALPPSGEELPLSANPARCPGSRPASDGAPGARHRHGTTSASLRSPVATSTRATPATDPLRRGPERADRVVTDTPPSVGRHGPRRGPHPDPLPAVDGGPRRYRLDHGEGTPGAAGRRRRPQPGAGQTPRPQGVPAGHRPVRGRGVPGTLHQRIDLQHSFTPGMTARSSRPADTRRATCAGSRSGSRVSKPDRDHLAAALAPAGRAKNPEPEPEAPPVAVPDDAAPAHRRPRQPQRRRRYREITQH